MTITKGVSAFKHPQKHAFEFQTLAGTIPAFIVLLIFYAPVHGVGLTIDKTYYLLTKQSLIKPTKLKGSGHYWQLLKITIIIKPFLITSNGERLKV